MVTPSLVTTGRSGDLLQDDVAALGAERRLHGLGQLVDASQQQVPGILAETQFLGHRSSNVGVGGLAVNYGANGCLEENS